jgi:hypothetical protein
VAAAAAEAAIRGNVVIVRLVIVVTSAVSVDLPPNTSRRG